MWVRVGYRPSFVIGCLMWKEVSDGLRSDVIYRNEDFQGSKKCEPKFLWLRVGAEGYFCMPASLASVALRNGAFYWYFI